MLRFFFTGSSVLLLLGHDESPSMQSVSLRFRLLLGGVRKLVRDGCGVPGAPDVGTKLSSWLTAGKTRAPCHETSSCRAIHTRCVPVADETSATATVAGGRACVSLWFLRTGVSRKRPRSRSKPPHAPIDFRKVTGRSVTASLFTRRRASHSARESSGSLFAIFRPPGRENGFQSRRFLATESDSLWERKQAGHSTRFSPA